MADEFREKIKLARKVRRDKYFRFGLVVPLILIGIFSIYSYFSSFRVEVFPSDIKDYYIKTVGGYSLVIGDRVLVPFGKTQIVVGAFGYDSVRQVVFKNTINRALIFALNPSKVPVEFEPTQLVTNARWMIEGVMVSPEKLAQLKLKPGHYGLSFLSDYHRADDMNFEVRLGKALRLKVPVMQKMVKYDINSDPTGASVYIGDSNLGTTPLSTTIASGLHLLRVEREGYVPIEDQIDSAEEQLLVSRNYQLKNELRSLAVSYSPKLGKIFVNGVPRQLASVLKINAIGESKIAYEARGYESQEIIVDATDDSVAFQLQPNYGLLRLNSFPSGKVYIDGVYHGLTPVRLKLLAKVHQVSIKADGYVPYLLKTDIANKAIHRYDAKLQTLKQFRFVNSQPEVINSLGISLKRFQPKPLMIGAPRNERGQRANEQLRRVSSSRAIYFSKTEITERQYSTFVNRMKKNSRPLTVSELPVTDVNWDDAAAFCNWLSEKENLSPFYIVEDDRIVGFDNTSLGYRLPSEAEWEYVARLANKKSPTIFVWGSKYQVPESAGNLADRSSATLVKVYLGDYEDNYKNRAPVGSYPAEPSEIFDMSGNVSEWVHDFYSLAIPDPDKVYINYMGEPYGTGHVVKGSSYLSSSWTELRASYRETANEGRSDIGFRVVRYIN